MHDAILANLILCGLFIITLALLLWTHRHMLGAWNPPPPQPPVKVDSRFWIPVARLGVYPNDVELPTTTHYQVQMPEAAKKGDTWVVMAYDFPSFICFKNYDLRP